MVGQAEVRTVLISSPGDISHYYDVVESAIDEWNSTVGTQFGQRIDAKRWSRDAPSLATPHPQDVIDRAIVTRADAAIVLVWHRLGTPTRAAQSGTVSEIHDLEQTDRPVVLLRCMKPLPHVDDGLDLDDHSRLLKYLEGYGKIAAKFDGEHDLTNVVIRQLNLLRTRLFGDSSSDPPRPTLDRLAPAGIAGATDIARRTLLVLRRVNSTDGWDEGRFLPVFARSGDGKKVQAVDTSILGSFDTIAVISGDPGSGKSIAMRHLAASLAQSIVQHGDRLVPVYVRLGHLKVGPNEVSPDHVRDIVERALAPSFDEDDERLPALRRGLEGLGERLLILFDGFDEIPGLRSSTEADIPLGKYATAIDDYMGERSGRAIIACRTYRTPSGMGWPTFVVQGLDVPQQLEFVTLAVNSGLLGNQQSHIVRSGLGGATSAVHQNLDLPLFLYLLCRFVDSANHMPEHPYEVYDTYFRRAFDDLNRGSAWSEELRRTAAGLAGAMTLQPSLPPTLVNLQTVISQCGVTVPHLAEAIASLENPVRLLYRVDPAPDEPADAYAFAHFRFQEHFASVFLEDHPDVVPATTVLRDGQWRESAVMALQTSRLPSLRSSLLKTAAQDLEEEMAKTDPAEWRSADNAGSSTDVSDPASEIRPVPWPTRSRHILDLISHGLAGRSAEIPPDISGASDALLMSAVAEHRPTYDRQSAVSFTGAASPPTQIALLRAALKHSSEWVHRTAYSQIVKLPAIPDDLARQIRYRLIRDFWDRSLFTQWTVKRAQLGKLANREHFLDLARFLRSIRWWELLFLVASLCLVVTSSAGAARASGAAAVLLAFGARLSAWLGDWRIAGQWVGTILVSFGFVLVAAPTIWFFNVGSYVGVALSLYWLAFDVCSFTLAALGRWISTPLAFVPPLAVFCTTLIAVYRAPRKKVGIVLAVTLGVVGAYVGAMALLVMVTNAVASRSPDALLQVVGALIFATPLVWVIVAFWRRRRNRQHDADVNREDIAGAGARVDPVNLLRLRTSRGLGEALGTLRHRPDQLSPAARSTLIELSHAADLWNRRGQDTTANPFPVGSALHTSFEVAPHEARRALKAMNGDVRDGMSELVQALRYPRGSVSS